MLAVLRPPGRRRLTVSQRARFRCSVQATLRMMEVEKLSLRELKQLITSAGLSADACIDKADLRARAREAAAKMQAAEAAATPAAKPPPPSASCDTSSASLNAVLALPERDAPWGEWRAAITAFSREIDVQPPVRLSKLHGEACKRRLLRVLLSPVEKAADDDTRIAALGALRIVAREQAADDELRTESTCLSIARLAGLGQEGPPNGEWDPLAAAAAWLLINLLVIGTRAVATPLCSPELGAELRLAAALSTPAERTVQQLVLYTNVAFHLSLQTGVPRPAEALVGGGLGALLRTLVYAVDEIDIQRVYSGELNEQGSNLLKLAEHAVRTLFNVLRSCSAQPDQQAEVLKARHLQPHLARRSTAGALTSPAARQAIKKLIACDADNAELRETQVTSMQLCMTMPKETAYSALAPLWPRLTALVLPLLQGVRCCSRHPALGMRGPDSVRPRLRQVENKTVDCNQTLLPLLTLQYIAEHDLEVAEKMFLAIFTKEKPLNEDPLGADPNRPLSADAPLEDHLKKLMCSSNYNLCASPLARHWGGETALPGPTGPRRARRVPLRSPSCALPAGSASQRSLSWRFAAVTCRNTWRWSGWGMRPGSCRRRTCCRRFRRARRS